MQSYRRPNKNYSEQEKRFKTVHSCKWLKNRTVLPFVRESDEGRWCWMEWVDHGDEKGIQEQKKLKVDTWSLHWNAPPFPRIFLTFSKYTCRTWAQCRTIGLYFLFYTRIGRKQWAGRMHMNYALVLQAIQVCRWVFVLCVIWNENLSWACIL